MTCQFSGGTKPRPWISCATTAPAEASHARARHQADQAELQGAAGRGDQQPALHGDRLVFASEGDLWTASLASSEPIVAHRLTSSDGTESWPVISATGDRIAFAAQYDGNTDVYVVPVDGGQPTRLTWHPGADLVMGWTPEGEVLFQSTRDGAPTRVWLAIQGGVVKTGGVRSGW